MAYYLGRDCDVFITTEYTGSTFGGIGVNSGFSSCETYADTTATGSQGFAPSMNAAANVSGGRVSDLIGVDLSMTSSEEDIGPFFGRINTQKITSGRKESTITVTRKKKDSVWDVIFNGPSVAANFEGSANEAMRMGARFGLASGAANNNATTVKVGMGLDAPWKIVDSNGNICYGYRVFVRLRNGDGSARGEILAFPNAVITGHSVSVNPDGTTEETMEFTTSVNVQTNASTVAGDFPNSQSNVGEF